MKTLYEFTCYDKVTEKNGEEEAIKLVPHTYAIKKPTRSLRDEAELFFGSKVSEGVKAGLLTYQMINKRYLNDGGSQSEPEQEYEKFLYSQLLEKQIDFQRLSVNKERSPDEELEFEKIKKDLSFLERQAQRYELGRSSLFNNTAEQRAYSKTIIWWTLHLSFKKELVKDAEGEKDREFRFVPVFGDGSYESKMKKYDELEDEEDTSLTARVYKRLLYLVGIWYNGQCVKHEDFFKHESSLISQASDDDEVAEFIKEIGIEVVDGQEPKN